MKMVAWRHVLPIAAFAALLFSACASETSGGGSGGLNPYGQGGSAPSSGGAGSGSMSSGGSMSGGSSGAMP